MIKVTIPNIKKIQKAYQKYPELAEKEIKTALTQSLLQITRDTKPLTPVDTGRLRASIGQQGGEGIFEVRKMSATVGTNVKYAVYVHEGTKYMTGRPFLAQGTEKAMKDIQNYFVQALDRIFKTISNKSK